MVCVHGMRCVHRCNCWRAQDMRPRSASIVERHGLIVTSGSSFLVVPILYQHSPLRWRSVLSVMYSVDRSTTRLTSRYSIIGIFDIHDTSDRVSQSRLLSWLVVISSAESAGALVLRVVAVDGEGGGESLWQRRYPAPRIRHKCRDGIRTYDESVVVIRGRRAVGVLVHPPVSLPRVPCHSLFDAEEGGWQ